MRYLISLTTVLVVLWLALSGVYKPLILALGAGSIGLVVWIAHRMEVVGVEHNAILFSWRLPIYWAWLTWQIVLSNLHVAACILAPGARVRRHIIKVPAKFSAAVTQVTYANSITLTPGTVSLLLEDDEVTVHALSERAASGLESREMEKKVRWLEGAR